MKSFLILLSLLLAFEVSQAAMCGDVHMAQKTSSVTQTFSQSIRSNPEQFFVFLERFTETHPELAPYLKQEGWISGDSHPGQWSFIPNQGKFIYTMVDFDMAGRGPLVLDLMQYTLNIKAIIQSSPESDNNIRIKTMLESYLQGLKNEKFKTPEWAQDILDKEGAKFLKKEQKYYRKKLAKNGKSLKIEEGFKKISNQSQKNEILKALSKTEFFQDYIIQDLIQKEIERGGSAGQKRYWVLTSEKNDSSIVRIFELKEKQDGFLPEGDKSTKPMYQAFWADQKHPAYFEINLANQRFEVRPKKVALDEADIPYSLNKKSEWKYLSEKANYDLYLMGKAQSSQKSAPALTALIEDSFADLTHLIKEFSEAYIKEHNQKKSEKK